MRPRTTIHRCLLALVLLCFQNQALAVLAMPCAQLDVDTGQAETVMSGCHDTVQQAPLPPPYSCAKCALDCMTGGFQLVSATGIDLSPITAGEPSFAAQSPHFYRHIAELPQRPPISLPI